MQPLPLTVTEDSLHSEITWPAWFLVFFVGFLLGATADLSALWLFHHWIHR